MLKQSVMLEVKKEDRIYTLLLPPNCPLGEVHDVIYQMRTFIVEKVVEAQKQDQPPVDPVPEQPKAE
jgi:hypothetical protein